MLAKEIKEIEASIETADSVDQWNDLSLRIKRMKTQVGDAPALEALRRSLERRSTPLVWNAILRSLSEDGNAEINPYRREEIYEEALRFDGDDPADVAAAHTWIFTRVAQEMMNGRGRFPEMRRRLMAAAGQGVEFQFHDLVADPDMGRAIRAAEAERDEMLAQLDRYATADEYAGGQRYREILTDISALIERGMENPAEDEYEEEEEDETLSVEADVREALIAGAITAEEAEHLRQAIAWLGMQQKVAEWSQIAGIGNATQAMEDELGTDVMRRVASDPTSPESQRVLIRMRERMNGQPRER